MTLPSTRRAVPLLSNLQARWPARMRGRERIPQNRLRGRERILQNQLRSRERIPQNQLRDRERILQNQLKTMQLLRCTASCYKLTGGQPGHAVAECRSRWCQMPSSSCPSPANNPLQKCPGCGSSTAQKSEGERAVGRSGAQLAQLSSLGSLRVYFLLFQMEKTSPCLVDRHCARRTSYNTYAFAAFSESVLYIP